MQIDLGTSLFLIGIFVATAGLCRAEQQSDGASELAVPFSATEFHKHVAFLASDEMAGRAPGSAGSVAAAQYIVRHFKEYGLAPLQQRGSWFQKFAVDARDQEDETAIARNILGIAPGQGVLKSEAIIVNAHYDHLRSKTSDGPEAKDVIYNGADDNASGVAALLMVAKAYADQRNSLPESRRTVIFASFDAEERGLLGAKHCVQHPLWPLDATAAIVNFDSIGRLRLGQFFASDVSTNPVFAQIVRDAARQRQLVAETRFGGHGRSDHAVFLDRNIPGVHFFTGAHSDYHRVSDEADRLNNDGGAAIAWIAFELVRKTAELPDRLEFHKLNPEFDMSTALNLVRTLGIIPNVNAQAGRYPQILFVSPNSPAAKHGLKPGDQIKAINGLAFNRVEDGLIILQQLRVEDGLRLIVLRDETDHEITLPASIFAEMTGPKARLLDNGKYEVEFRYQASPDVKEVYLAADFNDWQPKAHLMEDADGDGLFTTRYELEQGVYEYKFVIDGQHWESDPKNLYRTGKYDNSVLWVGGRDK